MTTVLKINDEPFLSTPSARRATMEQIRRRINNGISIHALREEGDPQLRQGQLCRKEFLSTPSARRATHSGGRRGLWLSDFYPRPPRGGRPYQAETRFGRVKFLSTPSARRATSFASAICSLVIFLSTPSARRATSTIILIIAIYLYFYPRPPRGGRRCILAAQCTVFLCISIHALREEGDVFPVFISFFGSLFLSTPSARRATAKTETKSLFSYKLYNILHEFRRALIYNGSKNYPNHAKRLENPVRRCRENAENSPFAPGRKTQNNSRPSCSKGG